MNLAHFWEGLESVLDLLLRAGFCFDEEEASQFHDTDSLLVAIEGFGWLRDINLGG